MSGAFHHAHGDEARGEAEPLPEVRAERGRTTNATRCLVQDNGLLPSAWLQRDAAPLWPQDRTRRSGAVACAPGRQGPRLIRRLRPELALCPRSRLLFGCVELTFSDSRLPPAASDTGRRAGKRAVLSCRSPVSEDSEEAGCALTWGPPLASRITVSPRPALSVPHVPSLQKRHHDPHPPGSPGRRKQPASGQAWAVRAVHPEFQSLCHGGA